MRRDVDWLLYGISWLVCCDADMGCIRNGAVAIDGRELVEVGSSEKLSTKYRGRVELDLRGYLVLPGLVNTHAHAAMSCFRGLGDDLPLDRWLFEVIFPAEASHVSPDLVYWGTLLSSIEMLKWGVTTFCDGYFFEEAAVEAAKDAGIRAVLGQGILDFPTPDQPDPAGSRKRAEAFLRLFPADSDRLRPSLFCHTPYTCTSKTLQWAKVMCRESGSLFQIHVSETKAEVNDIFRKYGCRPIHYLNKLGVLDEKTLCAHAVWVDELEMAVLAEKRVGVSHNLESNMKLGSGVAPVPEMIRMGVFPGIGTDGCASNNDLDLFSEMDRVAKVHKAILKDPLVCPAREVLSMATRWGAVALGWEDEIGSLEAGKKADLVAIDLNKPHLIPLYDPVSHLVYTVKGSDVRHVWVGGERLVADGELVRINPEEVANRVNAIARKIRGGK